MFFGILYSRAQFYVVPSLYERAVSEFKQLYNNLPNTAHNTSSNAITLEED